MDRGRAGVEGGRLLMWGEGGRWCLGRPTPARLLLLLLLRLWRGGGQKERKMRKMGLSYNTLTSTHRYEPIFLLCCREQSLLIGSNRYKTDRLERPHPY